MVEITVKMQRDKAEELRRIASDFGLTVGDLMRICADDIIYGKYIPVNGHLKPTNSYRRYLNGKED